MFLRRQLTLFIPKKDSEIFELARSRFNPKQKELIDAHVTLCREDEIENLEKVLENLENLKGFSLKLNFTKPKRFSDGKGVFMTCENSSDFDVLRKTILENIIENPRKQEPHLTLMHPRNSECNDEIFEQILQYDFPKEIEFDTISLIEQIDGGKWKILKEFKF